MTKMTVIESIELKLECGSLAFSPQEVATLLNVIRIKDQQLAVAMKRLGVPPTMMKEGK